MNLFIHVSSVSENVVSTFRDNGWRVTGDERGQLLADHPLVDSETSARARLNEMGLLVSRSLKIDFEQSLARRALDLFEAVISRNCQN
jgi:hypothetical protein